mmetsp:Transcript_81877/g.250208  ORF Transcript_81877/g.250208 Transcript_81877/m.250208 type:complete len:206 (+) Transcript_81877:113-730(+)
MRILVKNTLGFLVGRVARQLRSAAAIVDKTPNTTMPAKPQPTAIRTPNPARKELPPPSARRNFACARSLPVAPGWSNLRTISSLSSGSPCSRRQSSKALCSGSSLARCAASHLANTARVYGSCAGDGTGLLQHQQSPQGLSLPKSRNSKPSSVPAFLHHSGVFFCSSVYLWHLHWASAFGRCTPAARTHTSPSLQRSLPGSMMEP